MVTRWFWRVAKILGGCGLLAAVLLETVWLMFAHLAFGAWGIQIVEVRTMIWLAFILGMFCYIRWPWIAVLISWLDLYLIVSGVVPWNMQTKHIFAHQFMSDWIFFISSHVGFVAALGLSTIKGFVKPSSSPIE
jgi:hypothetical protein